MERAIARWGSTMRLLPRSAAVSRAARDQPQHAALQRNLGMLPALPRAGPLRLVAATQPRSGVRLWRALRAARARVRNAA